MIKAENLSFSYTHKPFIKSISFEVERGEIFGFLGPSGAGKSTLQKILTGILPGYGGSAVVNGKEVRDHSNSFYEQIGVDFEFPSFYEKMTAHENLDFFGSLYKGPLLPIGELLESVGLENDGNKKVAAYSKGMKSRLNFVKAIRHNPDILFLDEPTSGLDPVSSSHMKTLIKEQRSQGKAIILTTHNMQDATELCDRVAFIVDGEMKAVDTPHHLIMSKGAARVTYSYMDNVEKSASCPLGSLSGDSLLAGLIRSNRLLSIHSSEPTLNDIFIEMTGRALQ